MTSRATPGLHTPLCDLLGISTPILLAPMGDTAGGRLAAAVSRAGGLGMVGGGYAHTDWLERELELVGDARVGVGFITFSLDERPDALRVALEARPVAVQLSFGDPRPYVDAIRDAGAVLICAAQSPEEIARAVDAGADVIVAQGQDGGGHGRPDRSTMGLVPSMVDEVAPIPVVAAGGITDGRGVAAALMLGAQGVSMGTRFMASTDALSNPAEAAGLIAARSADTLRSSVFDVIRGPAWPAGYDGRAVRNRMTDAWHGDDPDGSLAREFHATPRGDYSMWPLWAGEGVDMITSIDTPAEILERVVAETVAALRRSADLVVPG